MKEFKLYKNPSKWSYLILYFAIALILFGISEQLKETDVDSSSILFLILQGVMFMVIWYGYARRNRYYIKIGDNQIEYLLRGKWKAKFLPMNEIIGIRVTLYNIRIKKNNDEIIELNLDDADDDSLKAIKKAFRELEERFTR